MKKSYIYWFAYSLIGVLSVCVLLTLILCSLPIRNPSTVNFDESNGTVSCLQTRPFSNCFNINLLCNNSSNVNITRKVVWDKSARAGIERDQQINISTISHEKRVKVELTLEETTVGFLLVIDCSVKGDDVYKIIPLSPHM